MVPPGFQVAVPKHILHYISLRYKMVQYGGPEGKWGKNPGLSMFTSVIQVVPVFTKVLRGKIMFWEDIFHKFLIVFFFPCL